MSDMTDRTRDILFASIAEFIESGRPVTSERLFEAHAFGIKPAMIRWELQSLADDGFFAQRHPSGGRTPTDKAYRFFVRELIDHREGRTPVRRTAPFAETFSRGNARSFIEEIAAYLGLLGVGYDAFDGEVYESGLPSLVANLGVEDKRDLLRVIQDFEALPGRIEARRSWWETEDEWPQVFIGGSPLTTSEHVSVLAGKLGRGRRELFLVAVGPKRMDYRKSIALFRALEEACE